MQIVESCAAGIHIDEWDPVGPSVTSARRREEIVTRGDRETAQRGLRRGLRNWLGQRWNCISTGEAHARGNNLLNENLSEAQLEQYEERGYFDVIGGVTGKRYRIRNGYQMNVEGLDKSGKRVCLLCFMPRGRLVVGDVMLAQKLALELYESEVLTVANMTPTHYRV